MIYLVKYDYQFNWPENVLRSHLNYPPRQTARTELTALTDQRAGFVTDIKDSPGLIRGRLEPQRGRSVTVKAVCGGTLGWKDPPFNSISALPRATHQDPTQIDLNIKLITLITGSQAISNLNNKIFSPIKQKLFHYLTNSIIANSHGSYLLINYSSVIRPSQARHRQKLRCHFCQKTQEVLKRLVLMSIPSPRREVDPLPLGYAHTVMKVIYS